MSFICILNMSGSFNPNRFQPKQDICDGCPQLLNNTRDLDLIPCDQLQCEKVKNWFLERVQNNLKWMWDKSFVELDARKAASCDKKNPKPNTEN